MSVIGSKRCKCVGTSSGPRIVMTEIGTATAREWTVTMAYCACDVCDEPWEIVDTRHSVRINNGPIPW